MPYPLHLLLVEDCENDAELLMCELRRAQFEPHCHRVATEADFLGHLRPDLDLIISDFKMPAFDGLRALELLKTSGYDIPFIIVSGTMGEERAVQAIKQGATDYLMKDRTERLGSAVTHALEQSELRRSRTKAEQAVLEGERKFRALFDSAHDAIYILRNGVFTDCNAKGRFMYGRTWNQIVGHTPDEFAPPLQPDGRDSREKAIEIVTKALGGEAQFFEWTVLHFDGTPVHCEVSLNRIEMGGEIYLMAVSRDVTERRRAEDQIAEQAALLDKTQDAIGLRDLDGNILFWNKGAERMYGWSREEVVGRSLTHLIYADTTKFEQANRLVLARGEWAGELRHLTRDGRELTVEARWTLLRDKQGRPKSILAINTDVTEKRGIETQLMRSQRMESIGTLAGGIAHDLNNILTPILTSIEILKRGEVDAKTRHILETIESSSRRGADIVRQVLSFARGVKGDRVEIQPKRLLKDIDNLIADTFPKNIYLELSLAKGCWTISGDPTQLHQVLLNLCVNARDAMPNGGMLSIAIANAEVDEFFAELRNGVETGRYVTIEVSDSGTGIPPGIVEKIFEPFFTTKEVGKGTGLGLSTVIAIVKSHGGFIDVKSGPVRGTSFKVYLPAMETGPEKGDDLATAEDLPHGNGETILIIDDETAIRDVTSATLETFGYRTLTAHDGAEAIELYHQHRNEIAVVLTDMTMPIMDGDALIQALHALNPAVRIIASSGFQSDVAAPATPPPRHFLTKPYSAETLLTTVRAIIHEPAMTI